MCRVADRRRHSLSILTCSVLVTCVASLAVAPAWGASWRQLDTDDVSPGARIQASMVYDVGRSVSVLYGGLDAEYLGDTWEWNGVSWELAATEGPSPRSQLAMAYDSARGVTVLFGGFGPDGWLGDTWEWDGVSWQLAATDGPSPRSQHAMSYDAERGRVVLFGGLSCAPCGQYGDTWEWDGGQWHLVASDGPLARSQHAMSYDSARGVSVLFGGSSDHSFLGDTWLWDGAEWSLAAIDGPSPRSAAHGLVYDAARGVSVLFSGVANHYRPLDTWEWNGHQWELVATAGPPQRSGHAMSWDADRRRAVLYGGFEIYHVHYDDTWEYSGPEPTGYCYHDMTPYTSGQSLGVGVSNRTLDSEPVLVGEFDLDNQRHHAFRYSVADATPSFSDLGADYIECPLESQCKTSASALNESGSGAGTLVVPDGGRRVHRAMSYDPNARPMMRSLGTLDETSGAESFGTDISAAGQIVGMSTVTVDGVARQHAFYWDGSMVDLDPGQTASSIANAIGDLGLVVGVKAEQATAWLRSRSGAWRSLRIDPDSGRSVAHDVNDFNFVVGEADGVAVLWVGSDSLEWQRNPLSDDGLASAALAISNASVIVGYRDYAVTDAGQEAVVPHAYSWTLIGDEIVAIDLNDLDVVPHGVVLTVARDVNDQGWIVGDAFVDADGDGLQGPSEETHAFVLEPISGPAQCGGVDGGMDPFPGGAGSPGDLKGSGSRPGLADDLG